MCTCRESLVAALCLVFRNRNCCHSFAFRALACGEYLPAIGRLLMHPEVQAT